jgi:predicted kinase
MSKIIFITGPSGSGKSTTAAKVAALFPSPCALLKFDEIRTFVKSGYAEPANGWDDETTRQWELAKTIVSSMAKAYLESGISAVIEAFSNPGDYTTWTSLFSEVGKYQTFAFMPSLKTTLARNASRTAAARLKVADIRQNHEWSVGWEEVEGVTVFDNTDIDVDSLTDKIISLANQH